MHLKDKRIFILEDNVLNRVVYQMIIRTQGGTFDFDRWGRETVSRLKHFNPDLIILDLMLPMGGSGFQVFDQIRENPEYDATPIVAVSASDPAVTVSKCQEKGFSGFIAKPVEEEVFPQQLARLINGEQVWYMGERYGGEIQAKKPIQQQHSP